MNFEAWQMEQKAQKDEERKRKTQAAEALRSYKGDAVNPAATKMAHMKESERLEKLEAERQLRGYRGILSEGDTKMAALREEERRKKREAADMLRGYQGTLSEEEAKAAALREEEIRKKQDAQQQLYENLETSPSNQASGDVFTAGSVSEKAGVFDAPASDKVDIAPQPATASADQGKQAHYNPRTTSTAPMPVIVPADFKLTVKFMFGLVSIGCDSPIEGYLAAVDRVVTKTIGDETRQAMFFEYPFLLNVKDDATYASPDGRMDAVRRLVTLAIPFTATDRQAGEDIKMKIVEAVRTNIQDGLFKTVTAHQ